MWWFFIILFVILIMMRIFSRWGRRRPKGGRYFRSRYREYWKR